MLQPLTRPYPRGTNFVTLGLLTGAPRSPKKTVALVATYIVEASVI